MSNLYQDKQPNNSGNKRVKKFFLVAGIVLLVAGFGANQQKQEQARQEQVKIEQQKAVKVKEKKEKEAKASDLSKATNTANDIVLNIKNSASALNEMAAYTSGVSRKELIDTLVSKKRFNADTATKAVDSANIDFDEQARIEVEHAVYGLKTYSSSDIVALETHLKYEGFTDEQASKNANELYVE